LARIGEAVPELAPEIVTGVSAGAINAAFVTNHSGSFEQACTALANLWAGLSVPDVVRDAPLHLAAGVLRWGVQLISGGTEVAHGARALLDATPLRQLLLQAFDAPDGLLPGVARKLEDGRLGALAVTATNYRSGAAVTFVQRRAGAPPDRWERPHRVGRRATLSVDHVMASASIPLLFAPVRLESSWYGDGAVRQLAPLSPALHLGAARILAISTTRGPTPPPPSEPATAAIARPSAARIAGVVLNALLNDHLESDATNLRRLSHLAALVPEAARDGLRPVSLLTLRPSDDLGELARKHEASLSLPLRHLVRGWGTRESPASDLLSTLLFESAYTRELIDCGRRDVEARLDEIVAFLRADGG
jgi:NTE family protein